MGRGQSPDSAPPVRNIVLQPEAERDLRASFVWYEERQEGLGKQFLEEVDRVFSTISERPELFSPSHRATRRARLRRFPYSVIYRHSETTLIVVGVLHHSLDPKVAAARIQDSDKT